MSKLSFAIAAVALTIAAPTMAYEVVGGGYRNKGECMNQIKWFEQAKRNGTTANWAGLSAYTDATLGCEKIGDWWFIVAH